MIDYKHMCNNWHFIQAGGSSNTFHYCLEKKNMHDMTFYFYLSVLLIGWGGGDQRLVQPSPEFKEWLYLQHTNTCVLYVSQHNKNILLWGCLFIIKLKKVTRDTCANC